MMLVICSRMVKSTPRESYHRFTHHITDACNAHGRTWKLALLPPQETGLYVSAVNQLDIEERLAIQVAAWST